MASQRGDVVLLPFPFSDQSAAKVRPAVVVSTAAYMSSEPDLLVAALTSRIGPLGPFDYLLRDWSAAGLRVPSALKPVLVAADPSMVLLTVGAVSQRDLVAIEDRLRSALGL